MLRKNAMNIIDADASSGDVLATEEFPLPPIIDLFAGVGGLTLGASRAGFRVSLAVELDPHAIAAHQKNFPKVKHLRCDIGELDGKMMLDKAGLSAGTLAGLIGGPPCQGFSVMGRRHTADPRNNLFKKFFQLVAECKPYFFLAENVLGLLEDNFIEIRRDAFLSSRGGGGVG